MSTGGPFDTYGWGYFMIDKGIRSDIWMEDMRNSMELCWQLCREKLLKEQETRKAENETAA